MCKDTEDGHLIIPPGDDLILPKGTEDVLDTSDIFALVLLLNRM